MSAAFTVLATDKVSPKGLAPLAEDERFDVEVVDDSSSEGFASVLGRASALIVRSATKVGAPMLAAAPELKVVGRAGVGVDNIDISAATEHGVAVINAPGGNTNAAAEMTMALMLSVVRHVPAADQSVREGKWDRAAYKGTELKGKTLGLVGAGRIGAEVAIRCRAFGMDVLVYDPYLPPERGDELGVPLVSFERVIEESDIISCHVPINDETRGIIGTDAFARMKDSAYVINASRGGVIDEVALAQALENGTIAGAGLDVFENEPPAAGNPLRTAPNLVMTPHLGASTAEAQISVAVEVAEGIVTILGEGDASAALNAAELGN